MRVAIPSSSRPRANENPAGLGDRRGVSVGVGTDQVLGGLGWYQRTIDSNLERARNGALIIPAMSRKAKYVWCPMPD